MAIPMQSQSRVWHDSCIMQDACQNPKNAIQSAKAIPVNCHIRGDSPHRKSSQGDNYRPLHSGTSLATHALGFLFSTARAARRAKAKSAPWARAAALPKYPLHLSPFSSRKLLGRRSV
jgi:hypothetical protein